MKKPVIITFEDCDGNKLNNIIVVDEKEIPFLVGVLSKVSGVGDLNMSGKFFPQYLYGKITKEETLKIHKRCKYYDEEAEQEYDTDEEYSIDYEVYRYLFNAPDTIFPYTFTKLAVIEQYKRLI